MLQLYKQEVYRMSIVVLQLYHIYTMSMYNEPSEGRTEAWHRLRGINYKLV